MHKRATPESYKAAKHDLSYKFSYAKKNVEP